jgi:rhodanese-related sulfurtransferase
MRTITPVELQMLIDKSDVELIDVRPRKDFEKVHVLSARSIPLSQLEPHSMLAHRKLDRHAPIYLMCRDNTLASLAACGLASAGLDEPIVVEGGLEAWQGQCLPVVRKKFWGLPIIDPRAAVLLFGVLVALGLLAHELFLIAALVVAGTWVAPHASKRLQRVRHEFRFGDGLPLAHR